MEDGDDVGVVASGTESTVTVGVGTDDKAVVENLGCGSDDRVEEDGDGGEIMVEVVGSDVFVDGVRGHGSGEDLNGEVGGELKEGEERESDGASGEGGDLGDQVLNGGSETGDECFQRIEGSSGEATGVVVVEDDEMMVGQEGLERGEGSGGVGGVVTQEGLERVDGSGGVGGEVDSSVVLASQEASVLNDEALNSGIETGIGDSLASVESTHEETKVVTEEAVVTISEAGVEKVLVEDSVERGVESVHGVSDVMDDQVCNTGIELTPISSSVVLESLIVETQVTAEEVAMPVVNEEDLNSKDEIPGSEVVEVNLPRSETDQSSVLETGCSGTEKDGDPCKNDDLLDPQSTVTVEDEAVPMNKEESLDSQFEAVETHISDGKLSSLVADQQTKVNTVGESAENHCDDGVDSLLSSEPTKAVSGGETIPMDDKFSSDSTVKTPGIIEELKSSEDQVEVVNYHEVTEMNIMISSSKVDSLTPDDMDDKFSSDSTVKTPGIIEELKSSEDQVEVVNYHEVTEMNITISSSKVDSLTPDDMDVKVDCTEDDRNVKGETTCGDGGKDNIVHADLESSYEEACPAESAEFAPMDIVKAFSVEDEVPKIDDQVEVVNYHEVTEMNITISSSKVDSLTPDDMDVKVDCTEDDRNVKGETTCGDGGKDNIVHADLESSYEEACPAESAEFTPMDILEAFSVEDEVPKIDELYGNSSGEDQNLKISTVEKVNGTSVDDVVAVMEGEKGLNSEIEVLDGHACYSEEDGTNPLAVVDVSEKDDVHGNTESSMDIQVESSVVDFQGKIEIPETLDGNVSFSEKDEELKVGTDHEGVVENNVVGKDSSVNVDSSAFGDHGVSVIGTVSDSFEKNTLFQDEKQEPVVQLAETQTHEGIQNSDAELVSNDNSSPDGGQTMSTCVPDVVTSPVVVNQAIVTQNVTCEADQNHEMPAHGTGGIDAKFDDVSTMGTLFVDLDNCLNKDQIEELQGEASGNFSLVAPNESQEVNVEEQNTDAEQVNILGGQDMEIVEDPEGLNEEISEHTIPEPGSFERMHLASSFFPLENEDEFLVSDLVWGKVRSHPWWPGQIFDSMDASEKAMKYHKKDCFLVAYFGDRTFAWNEAHLLKPFWTHFSEVEKHSNSETFHNAVSCALEEVSRRVELGLACSCVPNDVFDKMEYQTVENTGIRQELSQRYGVDRSMGVSSFEPEKLLEYLRALAQCSSGEGDRLELVIAKSQLLAISRLKGFYQLREPQFCAGLLENDTDTSQLSEGTEHAGKSKIGKSTRKRKHNLRDSVYPWKKEKNLSDLGDMAYSPEGQDGSDGNAMSKLVSSSSGKKRKAVDDGGVQDRNISIYAAKVSTTTPPIPKPSFKIGECIRRVASQLTGPQSILKSSGEKFQKVGGRGEKDVGFDDSLHLDDILSQLHLAARDPLKGYSFLNTIITFFSGFRNSVIASHYSGKQTPSAGRGRKKKASHGIIGSAEDFEFDDVNDSYWTDMIIQNNGEEPLDNGHKEGHYQLVAFDTVKSLKPNRRSYSRKRFSNGDHELVAEEANGNIGERKNDLLPTELILNFTEGDSVPSETNLNKMFRRFGPLKESETEVDRLTSRARVVFKKCSDAEVAFSSATKFNIFGPMLVNYQLSYEPSLSFRTLPLETLQDVEDAI